MAARMRLEDRTAIVTGAASGLGRAVAVSLARRGCHLALVDVNRAGLADTAARVAPQGVRASQNLVDVANPEAIAALPEVVLAEHRRVDILINNAGVALGGAFEEVSEADFEWLFAINFWGVVRMTRAFLPLLHASDDARIVNLSSVLGLIAAPRQVAYCASKFAVRGFSEALRQELAGSTVAVTVVHPGGIATSISENARVPKGAAPEEIARRREEMRKVLVMPPEKAGEIIVDGIERRVPRILVGSDAKLLSTIQRLAPVSYPAVLGWLGR